MVGITNETLLISATTRAPFAQVEQGLTPSPMVKNKEWSIFNGTLAGYILELRLRRDFVKIVAIGVAFWGGGAVRVVGEEDRVPE